MSVSFNVLERLNKWLSYSRYILNNYYYLVAAFAGIIICLIFSLINKSNEIKSDLFLCLSFFYSVLLLTIINFRIFDRYVLIFVPFAAIMVARTITFALSFIKNIPARIFVIIILATPFFIYMNDLPNKGPDTGALSTSADGFEKVAEYLKSNQGEKTQLVYFGHNLGVYGFYYLYNTKFGGLEYVFNINELEKAVNSFNGISLVVLNARDRSKEEKEWLKNRFKLIFNVYDRDSSKEKFIIYKK